MKNIKKFLRKALTVVAGVIAFAVALAWVVTFYNITLGLAVWSTHWLSSLI